MKLSEWIKVDAQVSLPEIANHDAGSHFDGRLRRPIAPPSVEF